jgi:SAM-dependent methyltransferase
MTVDPYANYADLYDLAYGGATEDLAIYENFARRCRGPVLELGVGTGRVALALARAKISVVGIDSSEVMLARARAKAGRALSRRLQLLLADMRDFDLSREFELIICAASGFHHLLTMDDQLRCLGCVRRHLAPGGLFVAALRSLTAIEWGDPSHAVLEWVHTDAETGDTVSKTLSVRNDGAAQIHHVTHIYDRTEPSGVPRERRVLEFDLRIIGRYEAELLLEKAGLELTHLYGDYDLGRYTHDSDHMIVVARRSRD